MSDLTTYPHCRAERDDGARCHNPQGHDGDHAFVDRKFIELIERSSLGTPGAKAIRACTPRHVVDDMVRRSKELGDQP